MHEITAQELLEWYVLEKIDPFGQKREDHRFALLASVVANAAGSKKPDGKQFTSDDFMLKFKEQEEQIQSAEHIERMFRAVVAANNAFWARKQSLTKRH